jgi:NTP pyrophosphatase (non-canonical NTP hydrolase)
VTIDDLRDELRRFVQDRDWEQFHSPKNLAMGTAAEAGELLEIFLWQTDEESRALDESRRESLKQEIGDVMIYLPLLADQFDLDPITCARDKLRLNEQKYPAERVRGSAKKYTEY